MRLIGALIIAYSLGFISATKQGEFHLIQILPFVFGFILIAVDIAMEIKQNYETN